MKGLNPVPACRGEVGGSAASSPRAGRGLYLRLHGKGCVLVLPVNAFGSATPHPYQN